MLKLFATSKQLTTIGLTFKRNYQVTVIGAAGNIGQTLSMLLKQNSMITRLLLYDIQKQTPGVATDLSHIPREAQIDAWVDIENMEYALKCADIVVIAQGVSRQLGKQDQDIFYENADALISTMQKIATFCPTAFVTILTDPINSIVPLASTVLETNNVFDKKKLFGITTLDILRAKNCLSSFYCIYNPESLYIPVIGGQSEETIVPLFSLVQPVFPIDYATAKIMTEILRNAESQIVREKNGSGGSRLSVAYAAYMFIYDLLLALSGTTVSQTAFVLNNDYGSKFFASPIIVDDKGIKKIEKIKCISGLESCYVNKATSHLINDVIRGVSYFKPPIKSVNFDKITK